MPSCCTSLPRFMQQSRVALIGASPCIGYQPSQRVFVLTPLYARREPRLERNRSPIEDRERPSKEEATSTGLGCCVGKRRVSNLQQRKAAFGGYLKLRYMNNCSGSLLVRSISTALRPSSSKVAVQKPCRWRGCKRACLNRRGFIVAGCFTKKIEVHLCQDAPGNR